MKYETAGDPMTGLKWTRKTTTKISEELRSLGLDVSPNTVGRLLKEMNFSLRVNHKKISHGPRKDRDLQFAYITKQRKSFAKKGCPVVSVDAKKKELLGNFKNPGRVWSREAIPVNDHDFPSLASGRAIPYGIYDTLANRGSVFVGVSHETPVFSVASIAKWWRYEGQAHYRDAEQLLILADAGGSNGCNRRAWKTELQEKLCDRFGLAVTVCHYPTGASKWNPIEHRLFSEIQKNWAGHPLDSYETTLNYIRTTKTSTGLKVKAYLDKKYYPTKIKTSDEQMDQLLICIHETLPKWNYTLLPRKNGK